MAGLDGGGYSLELDGVAETDVLVVGGGPAGCLAALSARRNGADVLLIEREQYLGGTMTGAMVNSLEGYRAATKGNPIVVEGIAMEVYENLLAADGTQPADGDELAARFPGQYTDPTIMMHVLDEMMEAANVDVLFNTFAFDAVVEDGRVEGVAVANKSGGQVVLADRVVDCSGDADVAAAAGAPFQKGREEDGRFHGGSMLMQVGGVDLDRLVEYLREPTDITPEEMDRIEAEEARLMGGGGKPNVARTLEGDETAGYGPASPIDWEQLERDREAGRPLHFGVRGGPTGMGATYDYEGDEVPPEAKFDREWLEFIKAGGMPTWLGAATQSFPPPPSLGILGYGMWKHGKRRYDTILTGAYEAWFDQTDQADISDGIVYMRKVNEAYMTFLRERIPGFEDAYIIYESPNIGTRESRRIVGEYVLTPEDQAAGRDFPDVVALSGRPPSSHSVTGKWGTFVMGSNEQPFDIPYRILLPKGVDDLLVAGRSVSVDHYALGGIRFQATCMAMGEAAGAAAALSSRLDVAPRDLDVPLLQQRLLAQNVRLFMDGEREDEREAIEAAPTLEARLT